MWTIIRSEPARAVAMGLVVTLATPSLALARETPAEGDALDPLRERFRAGMEKYRAGDFPAAILIWEAIYRELGPDKGYRLAFNLARAYDAFRDSTRAAEYFEVYVQQVERRRKDGEALEAIVEKQDLEARERLVNLAATKGRIKVVAVDRPVIVQIGNAPARLAGFVRYVEPGTHVVILGTGKDADAREITVRAGELVEVTPKEAASPPPPPPPPPAQGTRPETPPETRYETRFERPFSETVLWVTGGATLAAIVLPVIAYANALSTKSDYDASTSRSEKDALASDYEAERSNAYATLVLPSVLAAATAGLAIWYVAGAKEVKVPISVTPSSASIGYRTEF